MTQQSGKVFVGARSSSGNVRVKVVAGSGGARDLELRTEIFNHSPTGFEWGYAGSGPAQLALAILMEVFNDERLAVEWHQRFKFDRIAMMPREQNWSLSEGEVREWLRAQIEAHGRAAE